MAKDNRLIPVRGSGSKSKEKAHYDEDQGEEIELYSSVLPVNYESEIRKPYLGPPSDWDTQGQDQLDHNHKALVLYISENLDRSGDQEQREVEFMDAEEPPDPGDERHKELEMMTEDEPPYPREAMDLEMTKHRRTDNNGSKRILTAEIHTQKKDRAEVVTTRPFGSVKEAVTVFGERLVAGDKLEPSQKPIYAATSPPPSFSSSCSSQFNQDGEDDLIIVSFLKKLEVEIEKVKREVTLMKERETEIEIVVASLDEKHQKSMSKLSEIEENSRKWSGVQSKKKAMGIEMSSEYWPALAQAQSLGMVEGGYSERKKTESVKKKKPIVPLLGDLFSKRKLRMRFATLFTS
ncbi:hypothetical protein J5N97_022357 [Dioscorea zingiberensis]|uniref:Uncharacterized protein n=1 Tax=Dioscorea zingiberensis TaxID=325984 RepID=A0A9D5HAT0_9LILI|nr:hypothetical protein J5N97_022357 [Dioscorea zingiberensis]